MNYDLIYPEGFGEALSGGEREYEYEKLLKKIKAHKIDSTKYQQYLKLAKAKN